MPPSAWSFYPRLVGSRKPAQVADGQQIPRIEGVVRHTIANPRHLARYCALTGDTPRELLPLAYPHLLASRLHLAVLTARAFPVRLMGLVHVRNVISQQRAIGVGESFELRCGVEGHRVTERGQEIDLESVVMADGVSIWKETSTYLARGGVRTRSVRVRTTEPEALRPFGASKTTHFRAQSGIGRRYAWVAGDFNLIHLCDATARPFGFRRAIAHGMWSLARCATEVGANGIRSPVELEVSFRTAIPLPASLTLHTVASGDGCRFALHGTHGEKPHLLGRLRVRD